MMNCSENSLVTPSLTLPPRGLRLRRASGSERGGDGWGAFSCFEGVIPVMMNYFGRSKSCHCEERQATCLHAEVPACGKRALRHAGVAISGDCSCPMFHHSIIPA